MEMSGSCPACEGDVSVRFTGRRAASICRKCGYVAHSIIHQHGGQIVFEQVVRAAA
jgi:transcription initiation factor TFIIIB Brf1 subunit/transcription initiation factor TFIIB